MNAKEYDTELNYTGAITFGSNWCYFSQIAEVVKKNEYVEDNSWMTDDVDIQHEVDVQLELNSDLQRGK